MIGEKTLLEFRCSAKPYEACKYILENSRDSAAQFHAVTAIRDASIREWETVLDVDSKISIVQYLLSKCLEDDESKAPLVTRQLGACAGTLMKRMWGDLDMNQRESILSEIASVTLQENSSASSKCRAVELMRAVVVEFNPYTASQLGLPWDYHYECKTDLELNFLPKILQWGLLCAQSSSEQAILGLDIGLCNASLSLLSALLQWDSSKSERHLRSSEINIQVKPPESWRETLFGTPGGAWPLQFLNLLSSGIRRGPLKGSDLVVSYLQLVNNLASMHGQILLNETGRDALGVAPACHCSTIGHLRNVLQLFLPDLIEFDTMCKSSSELNENAEMILGACRALSSVSTMHPLKEFIEAIMSGESSGLPRPDHILQGITNCTIKLVSLSKCGNHIAEECAEMMLEAWSELSAEYHLRSRLQDLYELFCSCQGTIFRNFLEKKIHEECMEVYSDEEDFEGEEGAFSDSLFSGLASVGRCSYQVSMPYLIEFFEHSKQKLQIALSEGLDPSIPLEELCWLLKVSSYIIADPGEGETPLIPEIYMDSMFQSDINNNLVSLLSKTILNLAMDLSSENAMNIASSRLMEELCKALGRWSETYLLPDCKPVGYRINWNEYLFSLNIEGPSVVNFFVEVAKMCLCRFAGDRTLHLHVCQNLLKSLSKYEQVRQVLSRANAWQNLSEAYLQELEYMKALEADVHMHLTEALCTGSCSPDYFHKIITCQVEKIAGCCYNLPANEFGHPGNITRACNALSSLRGVARSSCNKSHMIMFREISNVFPVCLDLLNQSKDHTTIYNNVLELAADIVEYHGPYLSDEESKNLFSWAIEIIRRHSTNRIISNVKSALLTSTLFDDECDALVSLIRLLTQVTNAETCCHEDIATTVFLGVESVLPLLTMEHLKIPHVRHAFFTLLAYMVEVYPSKVAGLSPQFFSSFMEALAFGVHIQDDSETSSAVFEAITAFAKYSLISTSNRDSEDIQRNVNTLIKGKSALVFLYDAIISRIVIDDDGLSALDFACEPVLYLMAHDYQLYTQYLRDKVYDRLTNNDMLQQRAKVVLEDLNTWAFTSLPLDRASRNAFRRPFRDFIVKIRGLLRRM